MNPRTREWLKRLLILPPLALGIAILVWQLRSGAQPEQATPEEVVRTVRVIEATPVEFIPRALGYGTVQPARVWQAIAQVGGQIIDKHPDLQRGRLLEAGTVILRIDPADYELAVARSEASLRSAEARLAELEVREANTRALLEIERRAVALATDDLERKRALLARNNISEVAVDQAEAELLGRRQRVQELENQLQLLPVERQVLEATVALERAQLEQARLDLERTTIAMPFDGRIAEVNVEPTEFANVGQILAVADSIDLAEVTAQFALGRLMSLVRTDLDLSALSAGELAGVPRRFGLQATVRLETDRLRASWEARFDRISDRVDPQTRTIGIIVAVDEPYRKAIPGERPPLAKDLFVEVELRGPPWQDALVVPRTAVHRDPQGRALLYLANQAGRLEIRPVTLGSAQDDLVVVQDGLDAGARVVVSDLIPGIEGMRLEPRLDAGLAEHLLIDATGGRAPDALVH